MRWPTFTTPSPIGVDIGSKQIKAAQVIGGKLIAAVTFPRTSAGSLPETFEMETLAKALGQDPFRGRSVVLAVPGERLLSGIMEMPPRSSGAPIDQLARQELARRNNSAVATLEVACWDLPSPARASNRTYVMAVGCAQGDSEGLLDLAESNGLDVVAMDVHAAATGRACEKLLADVGGTGAILDIGHARASLVLLHHGTLVYERSLPKCGMAVVSTPAVTGSLEHAPGAVEHNEQAAPVSPSPQDWARHMDRIAGEMRIPLSYMASQYPDAPVRRILVIGGGAAESGLAESLASKLDVEVRVVGPSQLCPIAGHLRTIVGPSLITAMGLSQYA